MSRALFRTLVLLLSSPVFAQPDCYGELVNRWNRFASDANAYVKGLQQGVVSTRLRSKLDGEWESVTRCECW